MDPKVVDIPWLFRFALVQLIIAPFRAPKSAEAYHQVWTSRGSPLRMHTEDLSQKLGARLRSETLVAFAMRYGQPSIKSVVDSILASSPSEIRLLPLYPQYAEATTGSTLEALRKAFRDCKYSGDLKVLKHFYSIDSYISALANSIPKNWCEDSDHILFSFHGLPERQILRSDSSGAHCLKDGQCCDVSVPANALCYRHHCVQTAILTSQKLGLKSSNWSVSFQSRLGRARWIEPATDDRIRELATQGVKKLTVICPSFVADCLETLEEVGIRSREVFKTHGGHEFRLVPCLNATDSWVGAIEQIYNEDKYWESLV